MRLSAIAIVLWVLHLALFAGGARFLYGAKTMEKVDRVSADAKALIANEHKVP